MANGESFRSLAFAFRISQSYISRIIKQVLESMSNRFTPVLLLPPTKEGMILIADEFWKRWNFLNCVGAKSKMSEKMKHGEYFPSDAKLPNIDKILPYVHIGDEAFRLDPHVMRPYSKIESRNAYRKKFLTTACHGQDEQLRTVLGF